jgi:hypothetical protein
MDITQPEELNLGRKLIAQGKDIKKLSNMCDERLRSISANPSSVSAGRWPRIGKLHNTRRDCVAHHAQERKRSANA